jgi:hypothetical protein
MIEAGDTQERDLRVEVRHIGSRASWNQHGNVVWFDFMAPHRHLVVNATVTSARTNSSALAWGTPLTLPASLATGAQHGKLDNVYTRTSAYTLGTPLV